MGVEFCYQAIPDDCIILKKARVNPDYAKYLAHIIYIRVFTTPWLDEPILDSNSRFRNLGVRCIVRGSESPGAAENLLVEFDPSELYAVLAFRSHGRSEMAGSR